MKCRKCNEKLTDKHLIRERADLVFTDPPYGVSYGDKNEFLNSVDKGNRVQKNIENDHLTNEDLGRLLTKSFELFPLKDGGVFYICSPAGTTETVFRNSLKHQLRQCIVWAKQQFVIGRQDYHWKHESILYGWKEGASHYFVDDRSQDTVWNFDKPHLSKLHPTMKPIALVSKAINNSSKRNQIVFDGFSGSGSTLIACEKSKRRCRAMELDEKYASVIIRRWMDYTGKVAVREDGKSWND